MKTDENSPEKANEGPQKIPKEPTPAPPPRLKDIPMNGGPYLLWTYGFLITVFLLLFFFSNQTLFNSEYGMSIGTYDGDDLHYTVNGEEIIHPNLRSYSYRHRSGRRSVWSSGTRFFIQVINYKKDDSSEFVFAFGLGGDLLSLGNKTLHNAMMSGIMIMSIINFIFYRWGMSGGLKRLVERRLYAAQLAREARQANRKSDKSK
ncbi:MAG: hypothetical protein RIC80_00370 [Cyclobacteriaceae bacterium]